MLYKLSKLVVKAQHKNKTPIEAEKKLKLTCINLVSILSDLVWDVVEGVVVS